ncbi:rhomboid family intramembrane serine protease [Mucilaginibacter ximonensis]|uniref:Rhomboid family intramembrane serine protease n=1 Tax=Mucilaginibacter ximonensis TaxID=538021 RepID=A0ABW5YCQ5_9SPHI
MQTPFSNLPPVLKNLLIINILVFCASLFYSHGFSGNTDPVGEHFGAYYFNSPLFKPWQLITYMFVHGGWEHIIFNMFALYSFGAIMEYQMTSPRFLAFYFICGIGGVVLQLAVYAFQVHAITGSLNIVSPELQSSYLQYGQEAGIKLYSIFYSPLVGASAAVCGVLVAFGLIYPNAELMMLFIPVPIKAKYIISVYLLVELFAGFGRFSGDNVAHFAHIGGAILGFIMVKLWKLQGPRNFI